MHCLVPHPGRLWGSTYGTDGLLMIASDKSTGEGVQRRRPQCVNVHILSRGRFAWRPDAGIQAGVQRGRWASGAVCLAGVTEWKVTCSSMSDWLHQSAPLVFLATRLRAQQEHLFRSVIVSRGLTVQLLPVCMILIRTIAAQDTISTLSELI